jgi:predicted XRE-type DNA-binding protein
LRVKDNPNIKNKMAKAHKNPHRGSDFRHFLAEQRMLEDVEALAWKRALALQFQRLLEKKALTKSEMALRMKTSRAAVDRLLDASNPSVTLGTLGRAASALGQKLSVKLVPA